MRVSSKLGGYATDPCETFQYGETEDYCINVINGTFIKGDGDVTNRSAVSNSAIELVSTVIEAEIVEETAEAIEIEITEDNFASEDVEEIEEEVLQEVEIKVYPNPVSHIMNITLSSPDQILEVGLYDQRGTKVKAIQPDVETRIDVSDMIPGMYFVRSLNTDGTQTTEKVVIMN